MWAIIKFLLFIIIFLYYSIAIIQYLRNKFYSKKEEFSLYKKFPYFMEVTAATLLWLIVESNYFYNHIWIFKILSNIFYWLTIIAIVIMILTKVTLACALYYRMYGHYWDNPKMYGAQEIKALLKLCAWSFPILIAYALPKTYYAPGILIVVLVTGFICKKIYVRIIQEHDFRDESDDQQDQTRLNNRILLLFLVWIYIFWKCPRLEFCTTAIYLAILVCYYNKPLPVIEMFPVIKVPRGSPEREEVIWQALNAISETPIEIQMMAGIQLDDWISHHTLNFMEWGFTNINTYDLDKIIYTLYGEDDEDDIYDETLSEELKIGLQEVRNFQRYIERKKCPIHEYYLWWLMKDVPFYFGIKAFLEMVWDICLTILCVVYCLGGLPVVGYCILGAADLADTYSVLSNYCLVYTIYTFILVSYMGWPDIKRSYSWLAFYYRKQAYNLYDRIHPYAIYGPTVDGPRNWQYWFFIIFGYLSPRGLILLPELLAEEIRLTEKSLRLSMWEADKWYHPEEVAEQPIFWNPIVWYRLRNASSKEKEAYREQILRETKKQIEQRDEDKYLKYLVRPKWWTHYSI